MVASIFKNGKKLIYQEHTTILSGALVIGFLMLLSKVLGLVKVRLYAGVLGASATYDIFVAADRIPDLMYQLIIVGSLNAAFIPLFTEYITNKGSSKAWTFASSVMNWTVIAFSVVGAVMWLFAEQLSYFVAAGFTASQRVELVSLMRILLLAPVILGISSYVAGTLQSFRRFFIPFLSPLLYNLGAIFGLIVLYPFMGVEGLAWGVIVGAFLHLLIQVPLLLHLGFSYHPTLELGEELKRLIYLSLPRTVGVGVEQIKGVVITNFASLLTAGSISILRFAESIYLVPLHIVGVAIAQASLPTMSEQAARKNHGHLKETFIASWHQILFLVVPMTVILIVLKIPVVRLVLGTGVFDWEATVLTAWVMALLSLGLVANASNTLILRAFFALCETKLPVLISVLGGVVGVLLAATFMGPWGVSGLAFGITIGTVLEFVLLLWLLDVRLHFDKRLLFMPAINIAISGIFMAVMVYVPVRYLDQVFLDTTRVVNLLILVWLVLTTGGVTYLVSTWMLGVDQITMFFKILWKLRDIREAVSTAKKVHDTQQPSLLED